MRTPSLVSILAIAFALGLCAGWVDVHNDEVQATVLVLLVSAGTLGFLAPRLAVVAGLVVGLGVPIAHLYVRLTAYQLPYPMHNYAESFIALVPAVLAAVVAAGVRKVLTPGMYMR